MTREMISGFFDRPLRQAAIDLGISPTALKSLCRKLEVPPLPPCALCRVLAAARALLACPASPALHVPRLRGGCWGEWRCACAWRDVRSTWRLPVSRGWQIVRWPFQNARWITARAKKHACDREQDLPAQAPGSSILMDCSARKELEAPDCASFSFERKKPKASQQDHALEQLLQQCRFIEDDLHDCLPLSDILDGCNVPPPTWMQGSGTSGVRRAAVDSHAHDAYTSDAPTRFAALQSRRPDGHSARPEGYIAGVPFDSWFQPPSAGHEFNEHALHSFGSLSISNRNSDITFAGARDQFCDRQSWQARASSFPRERSAPEAYSSELIEMGYTNCDLSYLVGSMR